MEKAKLLVGKFPPNAGGHWGLRMALPDGHSIDMMFQQVDGGVEVSVYCSYGIEREDTGDLGLLQASTGVAPESFIMEF